jgi:hypothetical protein
LLENGINPNLIDSADYNALIYAAEAELPTSRRATSIDKSSDEYTQAIKLLVAKTDVDRQNHVRQRLRV